MTYLETKLNDLYRIIIRILGFTAKDLLTIFHQPRLVLTLILGPFLILLIFGIGYSTDSRQLETLFVVAEDSEITQRLQQNVENLPHPINYVGTTTEAGVADTRLRNGDVDLVIVAPTDPMAQWNQNQQAKFSFYHNEIDPLEASYIRVAGRRIIDELNQIVLREVAERAKDDAGGYQQNLETTLDVAETVRSQLDNNDGAAAQQSLTTLQQDMDLLTSSAGAGLVLLASMESAMANGDQEPTAVEPLLSRLQAIQQDIYSLNQMDPEQDDFSDETAVAAQIEADLNDINYMLEKFQETDAAVLVQPFADETLRITEIVVDSTHFFVPAALSLLVQHIAITMAGLSIVREQRKGALELFKAAPVSAFEILAGKYLSFTLLIGVLSAILTGLVIWGLGMPMLGQWSFFVLTVGMLLLVSLGLGFNISLSARSDSQAIQYAMILLLASIFFAGFFLPLYRLEWVARPVSAIIPATYSTLLLKDIMLRGQIGLVVLHGVMILAAVVLFLLAWWRLHRHMSRD